MAANQALGAEDRRRGAGEFHRVFHRLQFWRLGVRFAVPDDNGGPARVLRRRDPVFLDTVQGDLLYTALLFGGFALLERRFAALRETAPPRVEFA